MTARLHEEIEGKVPKFKVVEDSKQDLIVKARSIGKLRELQIKGELTSEEIVTTYCERAWLKGKEMGLICDVYFNEALEMAQERDNELNDL